MIDSTGFGPTIRDARIRRGLSIPELANATEISTAILRAIEAEDLDRLPGGVFTRGFLRSCAKELGVDPEPIVAAYRALVDGPAAASPPSSSAPDDEAPELPVDPDDPSRSGRSSDLTQMILIGIVVVAVGYLGLRNGRESVVSATPAPAAARETPVGTSGVAQAAEPARSRTPELRVELHSIGPCWMSATSDGAPVAARLMDAGDTQAIAAHDEIRLRLGDPSSVSFTLNGVPGRSLGESGQAVSIRITPQNLAEFQAK